MVAIHDKKSRPRGEDRMEDGQQRISVIVTALLA